MHDEWRQGSNSTSSAGGRGSNPTTSASAPNVPYRGQHATFLPEFFHYKRIRGPFVQKMYKYPVGS